LYSRSRYRPSSFIACELLIVIPKLVIYELIDKLTEFNSTLYGVVPAIPPREIVTYKLLRPWCESVALNALESDFLELVKRLSPARGVSDVPNEVVQHTNRSLAALGHELDGLRGDIIEFMLEGLYVRAEKDLVRYKIDDMAYIPHVALCCTEAEFLRHDLKARSVLRGIICDGVTEGLSKVVEVQD